MKVEASILVWNEFGSLCVHCMEMEKGKKAAIITSL